MADLEFVESDAVQLPLPPYIPWKTFENFVGKWKDKVTPHTIDRGTMSNIPNGMQRQLKSALRFLGHTDGDGVVQEPFNALVKAHATDEWSDAVRQYVLPAYDNIISGLPVQNATASQLKEQFRTRGKAEGQVGDKSIRFWLHAMTEAKQTFSPFFSMRQERSVGGKKSTPRKKPIEGAEEKKTDSNNGKPPLPPASAATYTPPQGTVSYPLRFKGKAEGLIVIPEDLSPDDFSVLQLTVDLIKAFASQGV